MAQQEEQQRKSVIKTSSIVAAGCASVVAAIFTSRLGVTGTLVGTALTSMVITLTSAILNSQFERASTRIAGLPGSIRDRRSTQRVGTPGGRNADLSEQPSDESRTQPIQRGDRSDRDERAMGFLERLRSVPGLLKAMSPSTRRRVLVSGTLAGIAATLIALAAITFTEAAAGEDLSSLVWSNSGAVSGGESGTSVGSLLGGGSGAEQYAPSDDEQLPAPADGQQQYPPPPGEVPPAGEPTQAPAPQPAPPADQYDQYGQ